MNAYLLLCDAAEVVRDRAFVLGGGWVSRDTRLPGMAVVVLLDVPWDQSNRRHEIELSLQDEDGNLVSAGDPPREVKMKGSFELGRPAGHPAGMPLRFMQAINFHRLPLEPSRSYRWELALDGEAISWASFFTRSSR
ncbi:MAG: hypothetical protein SWK76_12790 [Actinomycetota bacterium]|nr:hypothetical protein [Actinomycetota bacterium]